MESEILRSGKQEFSDIRIKKLIYVDKTNYIPMMEKHGNIIFLARPRRFGKSLLISTMDEYFSGKNKSLFCGLEVEEHLHSSKFVSKPVIRLNMSDTSILSLDHFENTLLNNLSEVASLNEIPLRGNLPAIAFPNLIIDLKNKFNQKVVILIDEYDSPMIRLTQKHSLKKNDDLINDIRESLANFYQYVKSKERYIHFTFITGITKFSKMSVFSILNNLKDISLESKFASIAGFTHEELAKNFATQIAVTARELKLEPDHLIDKIKNYYDGFSFDGKVRLYNPYSTLCFFEQDTKVFRPFWVASASDAIIRDRLKDWNLTPDAFEGLKMSYMSVQYPGEIGRTSPAGFLYQAGYLSLRCEKKEIEFEEEEQYTTDYPNLEVRMSIKRLFLKVIYNDGKNAELDWDNLFDSLKIADVRDIISTLKRQLDSISHQRYAKARDNRDSPLNARSGARTSSDSTAPSVAKADESSDKPKHYDESYYRDLIQVCLGGAGCDVIPERRARRGRADLDVRFWGQVFIIELKMKRKEDGASAVAEHAFQQTVEKKYGGPYRDPILIGMAIDSEEGNIASCVYEKNGKKAAFDFPPLNSTKHMESKETEEPKKRKNPRKSPKPRM
ncbi:MAG: ATP-binding protein [Deltaproteobacteria bacterium]|nr:ATP-binding protein [Deltaproteobacteria bacterium]